MIQFERIEASRDATLRHLYEHYAHDMSEWFGIDVQADGRFAHDTSPLWQGDFAVYLATLEGKLAGFAVVGSAEKWTGVSTVRDVKDFFVLRAYRRKQVGEAMARHIWNQFPAPWLVRVLMTNKPAVPFWRRVAREYCSATYEEQVVSDHGREWLHLKFDNSSTA